MIRPPVTTKNRCEGCDKFILMHITELSLARSVIKLFTLDVQKTNLTMIM